MKEIQAKGLGLVAVSYDPVETLAAFSKQRSITFPLLSDAGSSTIKRYGILNPVTEEAFGANKDDPAVKADIKMYVSEVNPNRIMIGMAFPGTFMLDRKGRVTSRFFEDFYIERNTVSSLMVKLGRSDKAVAATKVSSSHLDLTTYSSDSSIAAGNRISLVLDITPGPGIHVYAPGAAGYKPVALTITPQEYVRALPAKFSASQTYYFKPLKERVPVFQKPFQLVQEIVLDGTLKTQAALRGTKTLTLNGTLQYQACNDKECFNPVEVPLTWTLDMRPTIFQRPNAPVVAPATR